ncbi:unnamed protein product, partial [Prorocentrum cordatum]
LLALEDDFKRDVPVVSAEEFRLERVQIEERHTLEKRELQLLIDQVEREEVSREQ